MPEVRSPRRVILLVRHAVLLYVTCAFFWADGLTAARACAGRRRVGYASAACTPEVRRPARRAAALTHTARAHSEVD